MTLVHIRKSSQAFARAWTDSTVFRSSSLYFCSSSLINSFVDSTFQGVFTLVMEWI